MLVLTFLLGCLVGTCVGIAILCVFQAGAASNGDWERL